MRKNAIKGFLSLLLILGFVAAGSAQRQTGAITGTVLDGQNKPLPDAAVLIFGPSLLGTNVSLTTATGAFRFPVLLPGTYELRIEMPGFKTQVRPGLEVGVGRTIDLVVRLEPSAAEEEITVAAASPVVDLWSSKMSTNYGAALLAAMPMNRDLYDIQNSLPGAVSEESFDRRTSSILGGTVRSQLYSLDGAPLNDPAAGHVMININTDIYEEIEFSAGGHPAEIGATDSTYVNIVSRSGGNSFSGSLTTYLTDGGLGRDLWTSEQLSTLGVNPPEKYDDLKDLSLTLGGPILPDRIWFFLNGRRLVWRRLNPGDSEMRMARLGFTDAQHYDSEHQEWLAFAKLTFQATKDIRYSGLFHYNHLHEPVDSATIAPEADLSFTRIRNHENAFTTAHQFNWVLNPDTFLDVRGSYMRRRSPRLSATDGEYSHYDSVQDVWWGSADYSQDRILSKMAAAASITSFQDGFLGARHEFRAGIEFEQGEYHLDWYRSNPYYALWWDYAAGNLYFDSPAARRGLLRISTCPDGEAQWNVQDHTRRFSGFVQDSLRAGRLAVNLGLRLEYAQQFEPEMGRPELRYDYAPAGANAEWADENPNALLEALIAQYKASVGPVSPWDFLLAPWKKTVDFFTLSPRIGLVYDLTGDGKTAAKLSLARYFEPLWADKHNASQIFSPGAVQWVWTDTNGNGLLDLPPTDSYAFDSAFSNPSQDPEFNYYPEDLKAPVTDELLVGVDREIFRDFRLGVEFLYRLNRNLVEDYDIVNGYDPDAVDENGDPLWLPFTFTDPGADNAWGTADDSPMTVYGLRTDRPAAEYASGNPAEAKRRYWAAVLSFAKRMSRNWQLSGSILYSSFVGNCSPGTGATEGENAMFDNPNVMINAYGALWADRPLQIKVMGSYALPQGFLVSAFFRHVSGRPWNRTLRVYFPPDFGAEYGGVTSTYVIVNAEEPGSKRTRALTNLDLRLEKEFALDSFNLQVFVDIFNVAGQTGKTVNDDPAARLRYDLSTPAIELDPGYGKVVSVSGVRSIRVGARLKF